METVLKIISGLCWSLVYIEIIRLGFKYKTYGMPLFALALNFAWEFVYGFVFPSSDTTQKIVNIVWFGLDFLIVITFFRYGFQLFAKGFKKWQFISWALLIFALGFLFQFLFNAQFPLSKHGEAFSAFLQNVIMSALFIGMLFQRSTTKGQSLFIAINKCLGTLAPTILVLTKAVQSSESFELPNWNWFIVVLGMFCFLFDVFYIFLLAQRKRTAQTAIER